MASSNKLLIISKSRKAGHEVTHNKNNLSGNKNVLIVIKGTSRYLFAEHETTRFRDVTFSYPCRRNLPHPTRRLLPANAGCQVDLKPQRERASRREMSDNRKPGPVIYA